MTKKQQDNQYKGLPTLLHKVRWTQRFFAILAEVLILVAFFASGMDVGVGGIMANATGLKWAWAAIFALGVDTSFVVSWVRCRQMGLSFHLLWGIPVALGMSFVVFEPVVIQLMQASLNVDFNQAVSMLGINIVILVYARSLIAVILGAVLALTNVESEMLQSNTSNTIQTARRRLIVFDKMLDKIAPVEHDQTANVTIEQEPVPPLKQIAMQTSNMPMPLKLAEKPGEKIKRALQEHPNLSDRAIARMLDVAPSTVGVHRKKSQGEQEGAV